MRALVDADILVYRCGFSAEHTHYRLYIAGEEEYGYRASFPSKKECDTYTKENYPDGGFTIEPHVTVESLANALSNTKNTIESILDAVHATKYSMYLTGDTNFREKLVDYYKMNRKDARKPFWYKEIREYIIEKWGGEVVEGMEADDAMAINQWEDYYTSNRATMHMRLEGSNIVPPYKTVICTLDKDLNMIPGWHYNWVKKEMIWVNEDEATKFFYTQLLTGDSTDNITGIPGCGPAGAIKILEDASTEYDMYANCLAAYEKVYEDLGEEKLLENAYLLWMLREEGKMWTPPNKNNKGQ